MGLVPRCGETAIPLFATGVGAGLLIPTSQAAPDFKFPATDEAAEFMSGKRPTDMRFAPFLIPPAFPNLAAFRAAKLLAMTSFSRGSEGLPAHRATQKTVFSKQISRPHLVETPVTGAVPIQGVPLLPGALPLILHIAGLTPATQAKARLKLIAKALRNPTRSQPFHHPLIRRARPILKVIVLLLLKLIRHQKTTLFNPAHPPQIALRQFPLGGQAPLRRSPEKNPGSLSTPQVRKFNLTPAPPPKRCERGDERPLTCIRAGVNGLSEISVALGPRPEGHLLYFLSSSKSTQSPGARS
jgi:hypothetical protein